MNKYLCPGINLADTFEAYYELSAKQFVKSSPSLVSPKYLECTCCGNDILRHDDDGLITEFCPHCGQRVHNINITDPVRIPAVGDTVYLRLLGRYYMPLTVLVVHTHPRGSVTLIDCIDASGRCDSFDTRNLGLHLFTEIDQSAHIICLEDDSE